MNNKDEFSIEELRVDSNLTGLKETLSNLREVTLTDDDIRPQLKTILGNDTHIFVAREDEIIGSVSVIIEQKIIHEGSKVAHIEDVVTRKGHEGKGVATAILKEVVEYARKRGCYKVLLDCDGQLIRFYERQGFHLHGNHFRLDL